jgi:hypothetical protein
VFPVEPALPGGTSSEVQIRSSLRHSVRAPRLKADSLVRCAGLPGKHEAVVDYWPSRSLAVSQESSEHEKSPLNAQSTGGFSSFLCVAIDLVRIPPHSQAFVPLSSLSKHTTPSFFSPRLDDRQRSASNQPRFFHSTSLHYTKPALHRCLISRERGSVYSWR